MIQILRIEGGGKYFNTQDELTFRAVTNHDDHYVNLDLEIYPEKALSYEWVCTDLKLQSPCLDRSFQYVNLLDIPVVRIPAGSLFPKTKY